MAEEIFVQKDGLGCATSGRAFVNIWYAPPTAARLDVLFGHQRAYADRVGRHVVLSIVDPRVGREMGDDARKRARVISAEFDDLVIAHCFVILGTGFFSAMARSIVTGIQILSRPKNEWRVVADWREAGPFFLQHVTREGAALDVAALDAVIDRVMLLAPRAASPAAT